jgi:adenine-specific DNA-methyltransferase
MGFSSILNASTTSEGTNDLRQLGLQECFSFPKPTELIYQLIDQATSSNDLILDFFAGSGTTAHAVLKLNAEDGGKRRFILVSNTEATSAEPEKNLCRDVCARRVRRVIEGYGDTPGLPGNFAYLRCRQITPEKLLEIEHAQVWTALQLLHCGTILPFEDSAGFLWTGDEHEALAYVPRFTPTFLPALRKAVRKTGTVTIYSWQPELLRQRVRSSHAQHAAIPESLVRKFGLRNNQPNSL